MARYWGATRTSVIPRAFGISRQTFEELEDLIRSLQTASREFDAAMAAGAHLLAETNKGLVQMKYRGPSDKNYIFAPPGTIPIPRRTQRTYRGWYVRRVAYNAYEVANDERGTFFVEYGARGYARRPVLKMSAVATLRFVQRTRFGQRIMAETFGNLRNNKGQFQSFASRMSGSNILGVVGPSGYLPE